MLVWRSALLGSLLTGTALDESVVESLSEPEGIEALAVSFADDLSPLAAGLQARQEHLTAWTDAEWAPLGLSRDTLAVIAPLADRMGLAEHRAQLEDASFRLLDPDAHETLLVSIPTTPDEDHHLLHDFIEHTRELITDLDVAGTVSGRVKSLYSVHQKMERKGVGLSAISDRIALRVLVDTDSECYAVMAALHQRFDEVVGETDDYIVNPKANGYRSLHTVVRDGAAGHPVEVQVRTHAMHAHAEGGDAAHWLYKLKSPELV